MTNGVGEDDPLVGSRLGEFEIVEVVARGGMGATVYRAHQPSLDRFVALKVLPRGEPEDPEFAGRFVREAHTAAAVVHPNIIQVYAFGEAGPYRYIAMELVEGGNLSHVVRRHGRLTAQRTLEVMKQVATALDKAHSAGVMHRDIKPSNLLMAADDLVKVADFGLAKRAGVDANVTLPGDALGTPHYMSPEAIRGKTHDARSDLYSLGATAYHLLTGTPLFAGLPGREVMAKHLSDPPPPLAEVAPDVPPALRDIVHRLLRKNPADRFPSACALLAALERVSLVPPAQPPGPDAGVAEPRVDKHAPAVPMPVPWPRVRALLRRLPTGWPREATVAAALAAALVLVFILLLVWSPGLGVVQPKKKEEPEKPTPRLKLWRTPPKVSPPKGSSATPPTKAPKPPHVPGPRPRPLPPKAPVAGVPPKIDVPKLALERPIKAVLLMEGPGEGHREYEEARHATYSADFLNASVAGFGRLFAAITGLNVIVDPKCSRGRGALRTVGIAVENVSLDVVLARAMESARCAAGVMDHAVYVAPSLDDVRDAAGVRLGQRGGGAGDLAAKLSTRLSMDVSGAGLAECAASLTAKSGVNVTVAQECSARTVTLRVNDMPAESIVLWLARLTGTSPEYRGRGILLAPAAARRRRPDGG